MDENSAPEAQADSTPIFAAFRRGYDPEQVDRFVADQTRRLDEASHRASEAERRLAAAVGQLRELHRRVATLESEEREERAPVQTAPLDTLGERVQRVLQEAWEGAYALRQSAEQDVADYREKQLAAGDEIVATARRKAEAIEAEIGKRRKAYVERIEADRARAVKQMTYLHEQRKIAIDELRRVKTLIEATVEEVEGEERAARPGSIIESDADDVEPDEEPERIRLIDELRPMPAMTAAPSRVSDDSLPATMPVQRLETAVAPHNTDPSDLVRSHRASLEQRPTPTPMRAIPAQSQATQRDERRDARPSVFDFEEQTRTE